MIHIVVGTRAQLFKMIPVMHECDRRGLSWRWISTAQHRETIDATCQRFGIRPPDVTTVVWNSEAKTLVRMAIWVSRMLIALARPSKILAGYTGPEHVVVTHGDTTTTVFGALIGKIGRTKVMHVEAGLRSGSLLNPFPEEINRIVTSWLSDSSACPGPAAMANLERSRGHRFDTGANTQVDLLRLGLSGLDDTPPVTSAASYAVMSVHRFENLYRPSRLRWIVELAERVARQRSVVMPLHPVTKAKLMRHGYLDRLEQNPKIELLSRLEYHDFLALIRGAEFVMTDGGGSQEELAMLGVPTLILRAATERLDGLGESSVLAGFDTGKVDDFVANFSSYRREPSLGAVSPATIIVDELAAFSAD